MELRRVLALVSLLAGAAPGAGCALAERVDRAGQDQRIVARSVEATVQLFSDRAGGVTRAGSGVVLTAGAPPGAALVLTAAHLLEPPVEQTVTVPSPRLSPGGDERLAARILAVDAAADLALVEVAGLGGAPVALAAHARLGETIWVVGFPWGRERTLVSGVVSQIAGAARAAPTPVPLEGPVRLIDASVSYGVSGGGVFSRDTGALVGLVRGYRSAQLSFPAAENGTLTLPVAGETTVISAADIACFLAKIEDRDLRARLRLAVSAPDC